MEIQAQNNLAKHPLYQVVIGIEVHVQLKTKSKIFCSCKNEFGCPPNSNICPICMGNPGVLPVLNKQVVNDALMLGLATHSTITRLTNFARKHYFYPDLPKNYQITQDEFPICTNGYILIELPDGSEKKIRLIRIHMEEDAGKNTHTSLGISLVDLNRAGTPLLEIVSQPDMNSAQEARAYLQRLHSIVRYLGISDANMEEGSFRADINISVKKKSDTQLGTKIELKNINSFKFISQAIEHELERQIEALESGQKLTTETRQWDSKNQRTISMRSKEVAQDYRYFPEPDLPPIKIDDAWLEMIKKQIPELPDAKFKRLQKDYGISYNEALILVDDQILSNFFETTAKLCLNPKQLCNWILRDLLSYIKEHKLELTNIKITHKQLAELVNEFDKGTINSRVTQEIFIEMMETGKAPLTIIEEKNLKQIDSIEILEPIVCKVIADNPESVAKYKAGNTKLFMFFVGQAMKETQGKANPQILRDLIQKHLD